jgi:hypothetical protein
VLQQITDKLRQNLLLKLCERVLKRTSKTVGLCGQIRPLAARRLPHYF